MVVQDNESWSQAEREKRSGEERTKTNQITAEMSIENKNYCRLVFIVNDHCSWAPASVLSLVS